MPVSEEVTLTLTKDEAWVLFDFVRRFSDSEKLIIEDQAEERALWNLCSVFERTMNQEEDIEYKKYIKRCRDRLRDEA